MAIEKSSKAKVGYWLAEKTSLIFPVVALVISFATLIPTVKGIFFAKKSDFSTVISEAIRGSSKSENTTGEIFQLNKDFAEMSKALTRAAKYGSASFDGLEFAMLKERVESINERLTSIERSISDSPEKALSIPLLRKDQENMAKSMDAGKIAVKIEMDRLYEQQKWMLGGIGAVLLTVIGAALSALSKSFINGERTTP
ncbi:hypothetical protein [Pseudomonas sp. I8001]|uniref:hypothetical protein n=1 Tax=Pseudomonas sp. I8001 TaxID=2738825 RepID=UPI0015A45957|nr:hypothetical protein [Pseudomonas sp. I8001]NWB68076.1 hypothetical protein [Pseudomonas sp. I8001]